LDTNEEMWRVSTLKYVRLTMGHGTEVVVAQTCTAELDMIKSSPNINAHIYWSFVVVLVKDS
jgi:hypothetical protein